MTQRIAIVGSGISGLTCASLLSQRYDVSVFEANDYLGGHTHTIDVPSETGNHYIDTGFIVFNKKTYPNFTRLLDQHQVAYHPSEMSFSYRSAHHHMEYCGTNLNTLFADRRNLLKPAFYRFLGDILRFNQDAKRYIQTGQTALSIAEFTRSMNYHPLFVDAYLVPVIAAIWSKHSQDAFNCAAHFLFEFFDTHGLLSVFGRPQWYVITGGSRQYIPAFTRAIRDQIYLNSPVEAIERHTHGVVLKAKGETWHFDKVILATHSDQALKLLTRPTDNEVATLGAIPYTTNETILHTDVSVMPKRRRAWASWNYYDIGKPEATLTYYMNRLQGLNTPQDFCVSVNLGHHIDPQKILRRLQYAHPCFTQNAITAQQQYNDINGHAHTYYCGAYWGYGFHEDGVKSALRVCKSLGVT